MHVSSKFTQRFDDCLRTQFFAVPTQLMLFLFMNSALKEAQYNPAARSEKEYRVYLKRSAVRARLKSTK